LILKGGVGGRGSDEGCDKISFEHYACNYLNRIDKIQSDATHRSDVVKTVALCDIMCLLVINAPLEANQEGAREEFTR
jgi:hypothetical protein